MGRKPKEEEQPIFARLEYARALRGITRRDLAEAVDVHYQTIGYLERGEYSPSLALALRIARVLDMPINALFSLTPFEETGAPDA